MRVLIFISIPFCGHNLCVKLIPFYASTPGLSGVLPRYNYNVCTVQTENHAMTSVWKQGLTVPFFVVGILAVV